MTIEEFIKKFKETDVLQKENFISNHIVNTYIPYARKIAKSKNIIDATSKTEIEGEEIYCANSPSRFLLFTMNLIEEYTDIDIHSGYEKNIVGAFDALDSNGLIALLLNAMPQNDRKMFQMVFDMVRDDTYDNERSFVGWMDNKLQAMKLAFSAIPWDEIVAKAIEQEK